ncbi:MAG TPA: citrate/2-methylcitrate synthase, partial [Burkholderiaceae bacterium]|nr:citrate/2-methylcitrate synthase [Burkholderiaceae bacterium]
VRLLELLDAARDEGVISGKYVAIARAMEVSLARLVGVKLPINIDGATAAVYCELGFPAALGRGLFILSRSVGVLAHAYEQSTLSERIKGPMPPSVPYSYVGPAHRNLDGAS